MIGGVALVVLALWMEGAPVIDWTPRFVLSLLFLALLGTAGTTVAWFVEARRSRLDILTAWTFLTPVFGIVLSAAAFATLPTGWTAAGLVAVLAAMWVAVQPRGARPRTPTPDLPPPHPSVTPNRPLDPRGDS